MRRIIFFVIFLLCFNILAFSQTNQNTRYIAVETTALKSATGFFADKIAALSLGDVVTLILEDGKWSQVKFRDLTGWVASSALSSRRILPAGSTAVSAGEVALAGKGFSTETEIEYKKSGLDYSAVDAMERINVPPDDLLQFINEGRLFKGE